MLSHQIRVRGGQGPLTQKQSGWKECNASKIPGCAVLGCEGYLEDVQNKSFEEQRWHKNYFGK